MTYRGVVRGGAIVLEGGVRLPEGTQVLVQACIPESPRQPVDDLFEMGKLAVETGIPDLASNLDHYLYGHPKEDHAQ
jgi:hypothetical protein